MTSKGETCPGLANARPLLGASFASQSSLTRLQGLATLAHLNQARSTRSLAPLAPVVDLVTRGSCGSQTNLAYSWVPGSRKKSLANGKWDPLANPQISNRQKDRSHESWP